MSRMKKRISVVLLFAIAVIALLVVRARTKDSGGPSPNVVLDGNAKSGDIVTNGNAHHRLQRVVVRGTNAAPEKDELAK